MAGPFRRGGIKPYDPTPQQFDPDFVPNDARTREKAATPSQRARGQAQTQEMLAAMAASEEKAKRPEEQVPPNHLQTLLMERAAKRGVCWVCGGKLALPDRTCPVCSKRSPAP